VPGNGLQGLAACIAYFGMSLFFVLSGFVIYYNYAGSFLRERLASAGWKFFVARFARLYPLYAVIIVFSMSTIPDPRFVENSWIALAYATLTQSWFNVQMTVFAPAWSISTEWFFYLAFVPLVFLVQPSERSVLALGVYCVVALLGVILVFGVFAEPLFAFVGRMLVFNTTVSADAGGWTVYFAPPVRLLEFIAGMLTARTYITQTAKPRELLLSAVMWMAVVWCAAVILAGALTSSEASLFVYVRCNFLFAPAIAAFMLCVCLSRGEALARDPVVAAGAVHGLLGLYLAVHYHGHVSCQATIVRLDGQRNLQLAAQIRDHRWRDNRRCLLQLSDDRDAVAAVAQEGAQRKGLGDENEGEELTGGEAHAERTSVAG
jgi:peptidoglycan/LPS O-acetylase OafA/YrhL